MGFLKEKMPSQSVSSEPTDYAVVLQNIAMDEADEAKKLRLKEALFVKATNEVCTLRERLVAKEAELMQEKANNDALRERLCEALKAGVQP